MIAVGDIDGDGQADLAGSREVLWTALSSRTPQPSTGSLAPARPPIDGVVINELIASNLSIKVIEGASATPDAIELYNGKSVPVSLAGWQPAYRFAQSNGPLAPVVMTLGQVTLAPNSRLMIICDGSGAGVNCTVQLAKEGGTLALRTAEGETRDEITYADQDPDTSFGRFADS